ncbi:MAG TPA: hypothetical protein VMK32_09490 [Burkholderiaceae bacterium]|nr:hypothetical protein [Burkholderiaceae bacterium]
MKRILLIVLALFIAGCATVSKVETGEQAVSNRLVVKLDGPWNRFENFAGFPVPTWTVEGVTVDRLQFFVGIKDGTPLVRQTGEAAARRPLTFKSSMEPHEIAALFQAMLTADGSSFTLDRLEPVTFLGGPGLRFNYTLLRRIDDVRLSGMVYARVVNGELFAIQYQAPRLGFYPRYEAQIEKMAQTATLRT